MGTTNTITSQVSAAELRSQLSDVCGRVAYSGERIGITRNDKLTAVVVSVADAEPLEEFEMLEDTAAYKDAKAPDDGTRVSFE